MTHMRRSILFGWLLIGLSWCHTALANDVAACDPTHAQVPNAVTQVVYAADFPPTNGFIVYVAPTNLDTPERTVYLNGLKAQFDSLKPVPHRYWLCTDTNPVDGVLDGLTEMSQAQKDAIDAPEVAEQARQQAFTSEIQSNDLCTATLDEIVTRITTEQATIQAQIDAATNNAGVRTAMTTMNQRMAAALRKVARCIRARSRE